MHLIQSLGPFIIVPVIFVVVGTGAFIHIFLGLLTGGPRAKNLPGAPRLYDRVYYLLGLLMLVGWSFSLLSIFAVPEPGRHAPKGFMIGWGVCAVGVASLLLMRGEMITKAMEYKAEHGWRLLRFFYRMQARRLRNTMWLQKIIAVIFLVMGVGVLVVCLPYLPTALQDFRASLQAIATFVKTPGNFD